RWRGHCRHHRHQGFRQDRPAHRADCRRGRSGRFRQAAASHAGCRRRTPSPGVLGHQVLLPTGRPGRQAHRRGGQPCPAQNALRRVGGHGAGRQPRRRQEPPRHLRAAAPAGRRAGHAPPLSAMVALPDPLPPHGNPGPGAAERKAAAFRSTWVSVLVNTGLSIAQFVIGLLGNSTALVADAIHSLSDLLSDFIVLLANRHSSKAPDDKHPYGHYRFETAASLSIGVLLIVVGAGMLWSVYPKLTRPDTLPAVHQSALLAAAFTLIAKELLFRYLLREGNRVRSTMLIANAWHARSDAASSLVVAVGIGASLAGYPLADPLAALIVGLMIVRMGWRFFYQSFNDLMDSGVDGETEARIRVLLLQTPGVLGIHGLKTRKMGDMIWVEVDLEMDGN